MQVIWILPILLGFNSNLAAGCVGELFSPRVSASKLVNSLGKEDGVIGKHENSCTDDKSCYGLGSQSSRVGSVINSCIESNSCFRLGKLGSVGNLGSSCKSIESFCYLEYMAHM